MKKKLMIILAFMTVLANFIFADDPISGPNMNTPLEMFGVWNPNQDPLFVLSANSQSIDYTQSTIQYQTIDNDLSVSNQTENFNLFVYSNFTNYWYYSTSTQNYYLNIYHSSNFVPVDDTLYNANNYPIVPIFLNYTISQNQFLIYSWYGGWGWGSTYEYYIDEDQNVQNLNATMNYGNRTLSAKRYRFLMKIPSGLQTVELMNFNFGWNGYTNQVNQYWDMEGYVLVDIQSI